MSSDGVAKEKPSVAQRTARLAEETSRSILDKIVGLQNNLLKEVNKKNLIFPSLSSPIEKKLDYYTPKR